MGQFWLLIALVVVLWVPGRMWVFFLERKNRLFSVVEQVPLSIVLSVVVVDFIMIILGRVGIFLNVFSVGLGILFVSGLLFFLAKREQKQKDDSESPERNSSLLFWVVILLAITIKIIYLIPNIVPHATDLGHHSYWIKKIVLDGKLPNYEERDIVTNSAGEYSVGEPEPISDFIIGEHLVLSAIAMISGKEVVSGFSVMALFVLHVGTLLAMYALTKRLFERSPYAERIGVWTLFLFGVLYALGQSQMKYVTGGAIGNIFGNLFIPMAFLLLIFAVRRRFVGAFISALFVVFVLAYTHHLSTLLFIFALLGTFIVLAIFYREFLLKKVFPLLYFRSVWITIMGFVLFFFFFYTPSYIRNMAVEQVVGAPQNEEHLGFSFLGLSHAVGESRAAFGILGLGFLFFFRKMRRTDTLAILAGWSIPLGVLILYPNIVHINLPSARVANYIVFPLTILSGYAIVLLIENLRRFSRFSSGVVGIVAVFLVVSIAYGGFLDNDSVMKVRPNQTERSLEVFSAAQYLHDRIPESVTVMHDHINITSGDSWIKTFFMKDYNYPFYRAFLFRYDRAADKQEKCTMYVFSEPDSPEAKKCIDDLNVGAILVDEKIDGQQFQHFGNYWKVYSDPFHSVYARVSDK